VADHPGAGRRRGHDPADHPVPGGGGRARRPDRTLDHGRLVAEGTADELKRRIPGGHIRLEFASADGLEAAARALGAPTRDDDALSLQIPSDGSVESLRGLLDRLDGQSIEVGGLSIHTPDLDDVFLALTGQPDNDKEKEPVA
jgi:ABC-2 type transport system ATP-binding protein